MKALLPLLFAERRTKATHWTKKMEPIRASILSQMAPSLAKRSIRMSLFRTRRSVLPRSAFEFEKNPVLHAHGATTAAVAKMWFVS